MIRLTTCSRHCTMKILVVTSVAVITLLSSSLAVWATQKPWCHPKKVALYFADEGQTLKVGIIQTENPNCALSGMEFSTNIYVWKPKITIEWNQFKHRVPEACIPEGFFASPGQTRAQFWSDSASIMMYGRNFGDGEERRLVFDISDNKLNCRR